MQQIVYIVSFYQWQISNSEISYFEMKCSIKKYYVVSQKKMLYVRHGFKISHRLLPLIHPAAELIRRIWHF